MLTVREAAKRAGLHICLSGDPTPEIDRYDLVAPSLFLRYSTFDRSLEGPLVSQVTADKVSYVCFAARKSLRSVSVVDGADEFPS